MTNSHASHQPHGSGVRGLSSLLGIDSPSGRFGRLFPDLDPAEFSEDDLFLLAKKMNSPDDPKDGEDALESDVPAAYTYLGQFIDHDLTFDPSSFRQQQSDPQGIVDFRTPRFDLDNVYGRGPSDQPYLYDADRLQVGEPLSAVTRNPNAFDLPRAQPGKYGTRRAIIGDPRNDENVIVSQLQGLFFRFHNAVVAANPDWDFDRSSREVRWHYQWMVLHDFLPRIVRSDVLDRLSLALRSPKSGWEGHAPKFRVYPEDGEAFLPVEFSVAAYRLGHSMVRPGYRVNENVPPLPIFDQNDPKKGLNAFGEFDKAWTIDWQRFIDLGIAQADGSDVVIMDSSGTLTVEPADDVNDRVQMAYKLDTSMVEPLMLLPESVAGSEAQPPKGDARLQSLAYRNLLRGVKLRLPSGQDVARSLGAVPLADDEILIGAAEETDPDKEKEGATEIGRVAETFVGCAPLWIYVLAESRRAYYRTGRARLGTVGGTIVAETFLALMLRDEGSFLHAPEAWTPSLGKDGRFELADLIKVALGRAPAGPPASAAEMRNQASAR